MEPKLVLFNENWIELLVWKPKLTQISGQFPTVTVDAYSVTYLIIFGQGSNGMHDNKRDVKHLDPNVMGEWRSLKFVNIL